MVAYEAGCLRDIVRTMTLDRKGATRARIGLANVDSKKEKPLRRRGFPLSSSSNRY
jgi:hypothetical protein